MTEKRVGVVDQLWRYPVKSMRGEPLASADVTPWYGMAGDRGWAVRDEASGEIRSAKKMAGLLGCAARYVTEPVGPDTPCVEIALPDGATVRSDDTSVDARLSAALGRGVSLWPRMPASDTDHYRRREILDWADIRAQYGLTDDEPFPDMGAIPAGLLDELIEFVSPVGRYFDAYELHVMTTAALDALRSGHGETATDVRRFRPNIVVATDPAHPGRFPDFDWIGHNLVVGDVVAEVVAPVQRCVMITLAQDDLGSDRSVLRELVRETDQNLGVGLTVVRGGHIGVGDEVRLVTDGR